MTSMSYQNPGIRISDKERGNRQITCAKMRKTYHAQAFLKFIILKQFENLILHICLITLNYLKPTIFLKLQLLLGI